jgi:hypothetical protein
MWNVMSGAWLRHIINDTILPDTKQQKKSGVSPKRTFSYFYYFVTQFYGKKVFCLTQQWTQKGIAEQIKSIRRVKNSFLTLCDNVSLVLKHSPMRTTFKAFF